MKVEKGTFTELQERFIVEYLTCGNGTQAAIKAGYSEKTAGPMSSYLVNKHPTIPQEIEKRTKEKAAHLEGEVIKAEGCGDFSKFSAADSFLEAELLRRIAMDGGNLAIASGMVQFKAKLKGLLVEKLQVQSGFSINIVGISKIPIEQPKDVTMTAKALSLEDIT